MSIMLHFKGAGPRLDRTTTLQMEIEFSFVGIISTLDPLHAYLVLHPLVVPIFQDSFGRIRGIEASRRIHFFSAIFQDGPRHQYSKVLSSSRTTYLEQCFSNFKVHMSHMGPY